MPAGETFHFGLAVTRWPDKPALIAEPDARVITHAELDRAANRAARAFGALGAMPGDCIALALASTPTMVAAILGAQRAGLYYTLIPTKATALDVDYITTDSRSVLLVITDSSAALTDLRALPRSYRVLGENVEWAHTLDAQADDMPDRALPGMEMIYSSGTTGRPKGVRKPFVVDKWGDADPRNVECARGSHMDHSSVYLSTSPLYHSAPHRYLCAALSVGATVILMERFDAQTSLDLLDRHACTHSLWVPTMFHRLLKLDAASRRGYVGRSHKVAIHGAAPCPTHVKRAMIDWWGPILVEYYSGTEGIGRTLINSAEWLEHPGSVGRPRGCAVHILGESATELPTGQIGMVYFDAPGSFTYWGDADKTRAVTSPQGWRTFGDIGYVDPDGYLYLTDRSGFVVISGGVNVYPQEIESVLTSHAQVLDAAVFGVPDDDLGEKLVAVVQLIDGVNAGDSLAIELQDLCKLAGGSIKTPKVIEFRSDFPRQDNGKVQKHRLREAFLKSASTRVSSVSELTVQSQG